VPLALPVPCNVGSCALKPEAQARKPRRFLACASGFNRWKRDGAGQPGSRRYPRFNLPFVHANVASTAEAHGASRLPEVNCQARLCNSDDCVLVLPAAVHEAAARLNAAATAAVSTFCGVAPGMAAVAGAALVQDPAMVTTKEMPLG
jgi:hypothetical protein